MTDEVGVHPANRSGVHISDLEEVVDLRITGSTAAVDEIAHSPIHILHVKTTSATDATPTSTSAAVSTFSASYSTSSVIALAFTGASIA